MTFQAPTRPLRPVTETFEVETIGNGYLVRRRAKPSSRDPLAQHDAILFVADPTQVGEAVGQHMDDLTREQDAPTLVDRLRDVQRERGGDHD